jgi:hypothetical protein
MRAYAASAGTESGLAEREGREFSVNNALSTLVRTAHPHWTDMEAKAFIQTQLERCRSGQDIGAICDYAARKRWEPSAVESLKQHLDQALASPDNAVMVRWVIAGVIENRYGTVDRTEYLFETVTGRAK